MPAFIEEDAKQLTHGLTLRRVVQVPCFRRHFGADRDTIGALSGRNRGSSVINLGQLEVTT